MVIDEEQDAASHSVEECQMVLPFSSICLYTVWEKYVRKSVCLSFFRVQLAVSLKISIKQSVMNLIDLYKQCLQQRVLRKERRRKPQKGRSRHPPQRFAYIFILVHVLINANQQLGYI